MELKIDAEFRDKIPPLTEVEFKQLEDNIVADGEVREPLIVWHDTIIDGHHRWKIIQNHPDIPYKVKEMEFSNRWEAIVWMCKQQLGRRNLSDAQQTALIGQRYKAEKMTQGGTGANQHTVEQTGQNVHSANSRKEQRDGTAGRIGKEYGLSSRQVRRAEHFCDGLDAAEKVAPGFKDKVLTGTLKAPKSVIAALAKLDEPAKKQAVEDIQKGDVPKKSTIKLTQTQKPKSAIQQIVADLKADKTLTADDNTDIIIDSIHSYVRSIKSVLAAHSTEITAENSKKIIAALSEAETAINEMKGLVER